MDDKTRRDANQRLASAAGHIQGIQRMVEEDAYCMDVIQQIHAVQAALHRVRTLLLDHHLHTCVTAVVQEGTPAQREEMLREITGIFDASGRL